MEFCASFFPDVGHHSTDTPAAIARQFFLLKSVILEALLPLLMGLALAHRESVLESAANGSIRHGKSFWHFFHPSKPHLESPLNNQNFVTIDISLKIIALLTF